MLQPASSSRRRRRWWLTAVTFVTIFSLVAAACGDDDDSTASGGDGTTATTAGDAAALGTPNKATGTPVKIGLFNVEGGSTVSLPDIGDAAVAAADYANDYLGGLGGHPIEIVRCADKADGASATACGNRFVQEKVAAAVMGQPAQADQLLPTVVSAGIPYVGASPAASTEILRPEPFFFSSGFLGTLSAWATYAKEKGYKSFGIFLVDNPQAVAAVNALGGGLFKKAGVELQVNTIPQGTADASSQVQAALGKKPDAVAIVGDDVVCQAVLQGLQTAASSVPTILISPCVQKTVVSAIGEGLDGMVVFAADIESNTKEAKLYRAVMAKYAPKADPAGITSGGYVSMLGFVRAVNAGGLTGDATPQAINAAIKAAKNVPLPLSKGDTFSCDTSAMGTAIIKSTICSSKLSYTTIDGTKLSPNFTSIDAAPLFKQ